MTMADALTESAPREEMGAEGERPTARAEERRAHPTFLNDCTKVGRTPWRNLRPLARHHLRRRKREKEGQEEGGGARTRAVMSVMKLTWANTLSRETSSQRMIPYEYVSTA